MVSSWAIKIWMIWVGDAVGARVVWFWVFAVSDIFASYALAMEQRRIEHWEWLFDAYLGP